MKQLLFKIQNIYSKRWIKVIILTFPVALIFSLILSQILINKATHGRIYSNVSKVPKCHVALVLGAKVHSDGRLSISLASRCNAAIKLYKAGKVDKLLMSGDNRFENYNEPERMREYAVMHGVPYKDITADFAGRRTYDSVYRAKHIFGINKMIIISQQYHLPRAIFLAKSIGINAYGFSARETGDKRAKVREIPARISALLDIYMLSPKPVLGKKEKI